MRDDPAEYKQSDKENGEIEDIGEECSTQLQNFIDCVRVVRDRGECLSEKGKQLGHTFLVKFK